MYGNIKRIYFQGNVREKDYNSPDGKGSKFCEIWPFQPHEVMSYM